MRARGKLLSPGVVLRAEGAVVLALAVFLYGRLDGSWLLFAVLLLTPDLSMLGYLGGNARGAAIYNLFHSYVLPAALAVYGVLGDMPGVLSLALIWFAHIGMDRLVGYGLKYPDSFHSTHLNRV